MGFFRKEELPATEMLPGITRRLVYLPGVMLTFIDFEPGVVVPEHHHPHQQISWIVSGGMRFTLEGEERVLRAGDGVRVAPDMAHSAVILNEGCRAIDAFHPIREDYL